MIFNNEKNSLIFIF